GRQAGAGRGDVPPGLFPEGTGGLHRGVEAARRRLARLLLGHATRRATPVEHDPRCADAGVAGVVPEEGEGAGEMTGERAMPKKRKPHADRKPEDYMEAADNALELAKALAGQGEISDQDFLERMARSDELVDHDGMMCGQCHYTILGAEVAREMI